MILLSKWLVCNIEKSEFIKEKEDKGLLSNLTNIKIPFLSNLIVLNTIPSRHKIRINAINHFLLAGDKFIPEMLLIQPAFTYNACGPFTKKILKMKKLKETWDWRYIYQNKIDKPCFQVCFFNLWRF